MKKCFNWNCCNHLRWFCFLFSAEELGALKTTLNDWQHHQQLETLTLEAGNNNPLYCRQPEADNRMPTAGGRQPCTESQQTWASHIFRDKSASAFSFIQCSHLAPKALIQQTDCLQNWVCVLLAGHIFWSNL